MKSEFPVVIRSLAAAMLLCSLAACASSGPKKSQVRADYPTLMKNAEAEVAAGRIEPALVAFNEAAKADPTRKDAWVRTAQVHLNSGNYGRAIVAAEEVLKRDQSDLVADSVLTVAGLHVAAQSLQRLRNSGSLDINPEARQGAEQLAAAMRATLGEDILNPDRPVRPVARSRSSTARPTGAKPAVTNSPAITKPAESAGNPFEVLGGN